jgi:hypothetical protein
MCNAAGPGSWMAPGHLVSLRSRDQSLLWRLRRSFLQWAPAVAAGESGRLADVIISCT